MKGFVLDASVSASWCLADETNAAADSVLSSLAQRKALVPSIWVAEMTNLLVVAERRGRISAADAARATQMLSKLPITIHELDAALLKVLRSVARELGLSGYDACYVELAQRAGVPLATFDRAIADAAKKCGIELLLP